MTPKEIITRAESITILTVDTMPEAVELLSSLNRIKDEITTQKEIITRPLLDKLAEERAKWKTKELKLEAVIGKIRTALTQYQTDLVTTQRLEQELIAKKLSEGKIKPQTAIKRMNDVEDVSNTVESATGKISFKTVTTFTVKDWSNIPHEFLILNETLVRAKLKDGMKVAGLEYKEEQVPINFR